MAQRRPVFLGLAVLLVLWTFASGWLFVAHLLMGQIALAFFVLATGMAALGLAAFAVVRAGRTG